MSSSGNQLISVPIAVLIGSALISFSILLSGGIVTIKGVNVKNKGGTVAVAQPAGDNQPAVVVPQTEAGIVANLKTYAGKLGLDQTKFNKCLDSGEKAAAVKQDLQDGQTAGVQGTPSFFVNGRPLMIGAAPFEEFKKVIDEELNGTAPASTERKTIAVGNLPVLGDINAPVTFIEYSDYQCPFCGRFHADAKVQIKKDYIDTGKVKIYYRDFPLSQIHPGAEKSAEAARCAHDQGKFWEYNNLVFDNQNNIF